MAMPKSVDLKAWIKKRCTEQPNGCWLWKDGRKATYGSITWRDRGVPAHRLAYEVFKGEIPKGLVLDHLCREPRCVNPDHLEAVTHLVNMRRKPNCKIAEDAPPPTPNEKRKRCNRCGSTRRISMFYTNRGKPRKECKDCTLLARAIKSQGGSDVAN